MTTLRVRVIKLRVSHEELAQIRANAGRGHVATWLRELALGKNALTSRSAHPYTADLTRAVIFCANQLDRVAQLIEDGGESADQVDQLLSSLATIQHDLRKKLEVLP